jgi:hypothetical protein
LLAVRLAASESLRFMETFMVQQMRFSQQVEVELHR